MLTDSTWIANVHYWEKWAELEYFSYANQPWNSFCFLTWNILSLNQYSNNAFTPYSSFAHKDRIVENRIKIL